LILKKDENDPVHIYPYLSLLKSVKENNKIVDLTYDFESNTVYWPTDKPFVLGKDDGTWLETDGGYWYASNSYGPTGEHVGTHIDAPIHFIKDGKTIEEIPIDHLICNAIVVDLTEKCADDRDYSLTVDDLIEWEEEHGRMPDDAWLIVNTGWSKYCPDKKMYLGTSLNDNNDDKEKNEDRLFDLHFPGVSVDACIFLIKEKNICGIAIDTPSLDYGGSDDFIAHRVWLGAGRLIIENIANVYRLPPIGSVICIAPMKIKGGTGAPTRIFAILP
jgi:kynurenine formamidase